MSTIADTTILTTTPPSISAPSKQTRTRVRARPLDPKPTKSTKRAKTIKGTKGTKGTKRAPRTIHRRHTILDYVQTLTKYRQRLATLPKEILQEAHNAYLVDDNLTYRYEIFEPTKWNQMSPQEQVEELETYTNLHHPHFVTHHAWTLKTFLEEQGVFVKGFRNTPKRNEVATNAHERLIYIGDKSANRHAHLALRRLSKNPVESDCVFGDAPTKEKLVSEP